MRPNAVACPPCQSIVHCAKVSQVLEFGDDLRVNRTLEGHDKVRQVGHQLPFPSIEFRQMTPRWRGYGNFALIALEAECEPALRLATKLALQADTDELRRKIIVDPVARLGE